MEIAYSLAVALFLTIAMMPIAVRLAPKLGLIDQPDQKRKQHIRAIPRCGGMAMAVGIAAPLCFISIFRPDEHALLLATLLGGSALIIVFGLLDDSLDLNYRWKFAGQIIATLIVMAGGVSIQRLPLAGIEFAMPLLGYVFSFLFIIGVTNAVNLTDGLDGLAGGSSLLTLSTIAVIGLLTGDELCTLVAVTAVGGVLGFLRFNTYPAQVFMGDTGSQLLGFLTACLALLISQSDHTPISPALPILLLGLPILDTLTVMAIRLRERRSPFSPDRNHLHHQIISLGFRHNEAVAIIYLLQLSLLFLAFFLRFAADWVLLLTYAIFSLSLLGTLHIAKRHAWLYHADRPRQDHLDRRNIFLRKLDWFYHGSAYLIQLMIGIAVAVPIVVLNAPKLPLTALLATALFLATAVFLRSHTQWLVRITMYPASTFCAYQLSTDALLKTQSIITNAFFILLAAVLALAIRMTRREQFRLDNQDLLVLLIILMAPMLPFDVLSRYAIGEIALRLAVLMYSCEFILGRLPARSVIPLGGLATFTLIYGFSPI